MINEYAQERRSSIISEYNFVCFVLTYPFQILYLHKEKQNLSLGGEEEIKGTAIGKVQSAWCLPQAQFRVNGAACHAGGLAFCITTCIQPS